MYWALPQLMSVYATYRIPFFDWIRRLQFCFKDICSWWVYKVARYCIEEWRSWLNDLFERNAGLTFWVSKSLYSEKIIIRSVVLSKNRWGNSPSLSEMVANGHYCRTTFAVSSFTEIKRWHHRLYLFDCGKKNGEPRLFRRKHLEIHHLYLGTAWQGLQHLTVFCYIESAIQWRAQNFGSGEGAVGNCILARGRGDYNLTKRKYKHLFIDFWRLMSQLLVV